MRACVLGHVIADPHGPGPFTPYWKTRLDFTRKYFGRFAISLSLSLYTYIYVCVCVYVYVWWRCSSVSRETRGRKSVRTSKRTENKKDNEREREREKVCVC